MLGGRVELARMIGVPFPVGDYKALLIDPRNHVIHRADFADEISAFEAVKAVDELLTLLSPSISNQN